MATSLNLHLITANIFAHKLTIRVAKTSKGFNFRNLRKGTHRYDKTPNKTLTKGDVQRGLPL